MSEEVGSAHIALKLQEDPEIEAAVRQLRAIIAPVASDVDRMFRSNTSNARVYGQVLQTLSGLHLPLEKEARVLEIVGAEFQRATQTARQFAAVQSTINRTAQSTGTDARGAFDPLTGRFVRPVTEGANPLGEYGPHRAANAEMYGPPRDQFDESARQRAAAEGFLAEQFRESDAIAQKYMTTLEKLEQEEIRLNQIRATGAMTDETYRRAMTDIAQRREAASPEGQAFLAKQNKAQQESNLLQAQAVNLKQSLSSAESQHIARMERYTAMLKAGYINRVQLNAAEQQSLAIMRSQTGAFGKGGGQFAFQASYAVQDIATVASMQGMRAADIGRAAANNLSQMVLLTSSLNPAVAGLAAAGVTLAAVFGPSLWEHYIGGAEKAEDRTKRMIDALREMQKQAAGMRDWQSALNKAISEGGSGRLHGMGSDVYSQSASRRAAITEEKEVLERLRSAMAETVKRSNMPLDVVKNTSLIGGGIPWLLGLDFSDENMKHWAIQVRDRANRAIRDANSKLPAGQQRPLMTLGEAETSLRHERDRVTQDRLNADKEYVEASQKLRVLMEEEARVREQIKAVSRATVNAMMFEQSRSLDLAEGRETSQTFETKDRTARFVGDLVESIAPGRGVEGMNDSERTLFGQQLKDFVFGEQRLLDVDINELRDQNKRRDPAKFTSFSEFGRDFQLSLLKPDDKAYTQRERQITLLEDLRFNLGRFAEALANGDRTPRMGP